MPFVALAPARSSRQGEAMKRIVVCYDGTWNALTDPAAVTNVVRVGQAVKASDEHERSQIVYYLSLIHISEPTRH